MRCFVLLIVACLVSSALGAEVPPPSATPAEIIVNGTTSTAKDIVVVDVGQNVPDTYSAPDFRPTAGFKFYVSEHYALKTDMGDDWARHVLELSELALPHMIELTGLTPPDPTKRMAIIYGQSRETMNRAMQSDIGTQWHGPGGGITLYNNYAAYNYPSGALTYHKRALLIHENLHLLQGVVTKHSMGGENTTYAFEQHVYNDDEKQLTVLVFDKAPINNWTDTGLAELQNAFVSISDFFRHRFGSGDGAQVFLHFFLSDPDRWMRWRLVRDAMYNHEPILETAEKAFDLDQLNDEWEAWLAKRRNTFRHVDWGWEQNGNVIWAYGFPWDGNYWSQMDLRHAPDEQVEYDPLRMDYPAEPMPPIVGPVERGVPEPSIGYVVSGVGGGCWGGFGLGVEGRSMCQVVLSNNQLLVIDGRSFGIARKEVALTPEVNAAAANDSGRYGVTIQIKRNELEVTVRAGTADGMKEMKTAVPIDAAQRERLLSKHMAMIGRHGYPRITPWIDDARRLPPDLTQPGPPNRWRFPALDQVYGLYKAEHRLGSATPQSLSQLRAQMVAAVDKAPDVQSRAIREYNNGLAAVIQDVQKAGIDAYARQLALSDITGISIGVALTQGQGPDEVVASATLRGARQLGATGRVVWKMNGEPAGEPETINLDPRKIIDLRQAWIVKRADAAPVTITATAELEWNGTPFTFTGTGTCRTSIPAWLVAGPFPNPGGGAADVKHPIETEPFDREKTYQAGKIGWQLVQQPADTPVTGEHAVDLIKVYGQQDNVAAYAVTWIDSEKDQDAILELGSDDGVIVWLNDKEVHRNLVARGYSPRQDRVRVSLKTGRNKLMLKIMQGGGGWGFGAHLVTPERGAVQGVRFSTDKPLPFVPPGRVEIRPPAAPAVPVA